MALYRNIAGAEQLGLLLQAAPELDGGGGMVFYDPWYIETPPSLQPVAPVQVIPSQPLTPTETTTAPVTTDIPAVTETPAVQTTTTDPAPVPAPDTVDWWPLVTIAGLLYTAIDGEAAFKKNRKVVFVGGLGLLYYQLVRKK